MKRFVFDTADTTNVSKMGVGEWSLNLNHQISCSKLVVSNIIIPHTFYNINSTNNEYEIYFNDNTIKSYKFPIQYMNYNDIVSQNINGLMLSFDKKTFRFTVSRALLSNIVGIKFITSYKLFGFEPNTTYDFGSMNEIIAPNVADLNSIPAVYIRCNQLNSKFVYNNNRTSILHRLPVDKPFGQLLIYQNNSTDMFINQDNIGYLQFSLTDNRGQHINLNGADWKIEMILLD